jgi:hypothetical protein
MVEVVVPQVSDGVLDRCDAEHATGFVATAKKVIVVRLDKRRITRHASDAVLFCNRGAERVSDDGLECLVCKPSRLVERLLELVHVLLAAHGVSGYGWLGWLSFEDPKRLLLYLPRAQAGQAEQNNRSFPGGPSALSRRNFTSPGRVAVNVVGQAVRPRPSGRTRRSLLVRE